MNSIVCVKRTPDTETRIQIASDGQSIEVRDVNYILNPYDEYAVEEAIRLKEQFGGEVTVLCLGPPEAVSVLRNAVALGADRAILLKTDIIGIDSAQTAVALAEAIQEQAYDIIWFGKQAVDDDNAQVGPMVAELLSIPSVCQVVKLEATPDRLVAVCEVEGAEESVETGFPVAVTAQKGLNEPRYASLKDLMRAKRTPIDERDVVLKSARVETVALALPPQRQAGRFNGKGIEAVPELVRRLREEAKAL